MNRAAAGAKALEAKDFRAAIEHYTKALAELPKAVDYYIKRSTAYVRLSPPNTLLSLLDAETAVVLAKARGKRELVGQAQLRRGIALFGSERYADAGQCFKWAKEMLPKDNSLGMWFARVETKAKDIPEGDDRAEIRVKEEPEVDLDGILKKAVKPAVPKPTTTSTSSPLQPTSSEPGPAPGPQKIRHDWYQSSDTVTITLLAKSVDKECAIVDIQPHSLTIAFPLPTDSEYDFSLDPLYAAIDPATSSYKIMSTKIEVILKKILKGQKWHSLEGTSPPADVTSSESAAQPVISEPPKPPGPVYPSSSKHGTKDWDKLATDLTKKPPQTDNAEPEYDSDEGGDPVNAFFKNLYKDATPETRRAMIKSYQESNGTALSTNWAEVSKAPVETSPPEGMEAKKW